MHDLRTLKLRNAVAERPCSKCGTRGETRPNKSYRLTALFTRVRYAALCEPCVCDYTEAGTYCGPLNVDYFYADGETLKVKHVRDGFVVVTPPWDGSDVGEYRAARRETEVA